MSSPMLPAHMAPQRPPNIENYYVPIIPPPTPAPSPGPSGRSEHQSRRELSCMYPIPPQDFPLRRQYLFEVLKSCSPAELLYISTSIAPRLKRDFLRFLPAELAIHILAFVDEPRTLSRMAQVSKYWNNLVRDECVWKRMCLWYGFDDLPAERKAEWSSASKGKSAIWNSVVRSVTDIAHDRPTNDAQPSDASKPKLSAIYQHFKLSYMTSWFDFLAYSDKLTIPGQ